MAELEHQQERVQVVQDYENMCLTMQADAWQNERVSLMNGSKIAGVLMQMAAITILPPQILPDPIASATPWDDKWIIWNKMQNCIKQQLSSAGGLSGQRSP